MENNYYIDFEFLEGTQTKRFLGIPYGKTKPTIDPISVGIVSEDNREYYAVFKDFNLKEAWNRYDLVYNTGCGDANNLPPKKVYWIRENVLKPIFDELLFKEKYVTEYIKGSFNLQAHNVRIDNPRYLKFSYNNLKYLLNKYGKTKEQIAKEIKTFIGTKETIGNWEEIKDNMNTNLYGYYCDFDFLCLTWLFGKMIDLPDSFPKYMIDLKQILDEKVSKFNRTDFFTAFDFKNEGLKELTHSEKLEHIKMHVRYPNQTNEHNSLNDAKFNKELHEFLNTL